MFKKEGFVKFTINGVQISGMYQYELITAISSGLRNLIEKNVLTKEEVEVIYKEAILEQEELLDFMKDKLKEMGKIFEEKGEKDDK